MGAPRASDATDGGASAAAGAPSAAAIEAAAARVAPIVRRTPLDAAPALGEPLGLRVALKCEHLQRTGSFKLRGAANALLALEPEVRARGVVAASSGNHGLAVAHAARRLGTTCTVLVPRTAAPTKLEAIRRLGGIVELVDSDDSADAEREARGRAAREERAYVSPYNDPTVIAGQGTVAAELLDQLAEAELDGLDAVVVAVGGGGLVSGVGALLAERAPEVTVVGASPANDAAMAAAVAARRIVDVPTAPTLSDGTAGGIEPGAITLALCAQLVDRWILVDEAEIAAGVRAVLEHHHQLVEGAAGVAVAALAPLAAAMPGARVAVVSCGANISPQALRALL
jgi:threonine dehydratase